MSVSVDLSIQHVVRVRYIVICGVTGTVKNSNST